uniref:Uncharacterized protein n=1 Tax=Noctiluca scintillans TaxID=2966 RepID=A0A7S1AYJ2_NOCSC
MLGLCACLFAVGVLSTKALEINGQEFVWRPEQTQVQHANLRPQATWREPVDTAHNVPQNYIRGASLREERQGAQLPHDRAQFQPSRTSVQDPVERLGGASLQSSPRARADHLNSQPSTSFRAAQTSSIMDSWSQVKQTFPTQGAAQPQWADRPREPLLEVDTVPMDANRFAQGAMPQPKPNLLQQGQGSVGGAAQQNVASSSSFLLNVLGSLKSQLRQETAEKNQLEAENEDLMKEVQLWKATTGRAAERDRQAASVLQRLMDHGK